MICKVHGGSIVHEKIFECSIRVFRRASDLCTLDSRIQSRIQSSPGNSTSPVHYLHIHLKHSRDISCAVVRASMMFSSEQICLANSAHSV